MPRYVTHDEYEDSLGTIISVIGSGTAHFWLLVQVSCFLFLSIIFRPRRGFQWTCFGAFLFQFLAFVHFRIRARGSRNFINIFIASSLLSCAGYLVLASGEGYNYALEVVDMRHAIRLTSRYRIDDHAIPLQVDYLLPSLRRPSRNHAVDGVGVLLPRRGAQAHPTFSSLSQHAIKI